MKSDALKTGSKNWLWLYRIKLTAEGNGLCDSTILLVKSDQLFPQHKYSPWMFHERLKGDQLTMSTRYGRCKKQTKHLLRVNNST